MKNVLLAYHSHAGHTARIARRICEAIQAEGSRCDVYEIMEICREGVDWSQYDAVIVGAPVLYGTYDKIVWEFARRFKHQLETLPSSFFNVSVVARTPFKATPEGNRYLQKFIERSAWRPRDLKCIAGKVDYPNWGWLDTKMIQLIMKVTNGPTDPTSVIDYTDYEDLKHYAHHCLNLDQ